MSSSKDLTIEDVLAGRYATDEMKKIWSSVGKIIAERQLWIAVMRAQKAQGVDIPDGVIEAYEEMISNVDLKSIADRERVTKHDVKARIEEFCALAGHEHIHKGMTSRDLTDNVEQMQVMKSLQLVRSRLVAVISVWGEKAREHRDLVVMGRSHLQPGQLTTVGKRLAASGEELLCAYMALEDLIERYPLRGMKGAMGTSQDMLDLVEGDTERLRQIENQVATFLGFERVLSSVGQIYPRSLDYSVLTTLAQIAAGPSNLAWTIRIMASSNLATEGFMPGQVGSSAMPHKMNPRTCERINGFNDILHGFVASVSRLSGEQILEGDVSCSVVRRVALDDAFFAIDGLIESTLTVLTGMGFFPYLIDREVDENLPFLSTTKFLMEAVKLGVNREEAHEAIKEQSVTVGRSMREGGYRASDLIGLLVDDERLPFTAIRLRELMNELRTSPGATGLQVDDFCFRTRRIEERHPEDALYRAGDIL